MRGVDILLYVNTGTDAAPVWTAVGGQRNATLSEESDTIDITSKDSGGVAEYDYGLYSWSISADGVYIPDETAYEYLKNAMRNKQKVKVRIKENGGTGTNAEEGLAVITSRELEAPYDGEVTYKLELQGTGALTPTTVS
jgi:TP901-1 family phage major tail protein